MSSNIKGSVGELWEGMMKVTIEGISQRAKNRIRENGKEFFVLRKLENTILLCSNPSIEEDGWFGWFNNNEIKILDTPNSIKEE